MIKMEFVIADKIFRLQAPTLDEIKYQEFFWIFLGVEMPQEFYHEAVKRGFIIPREEPITPQEESLPEQEAYPPYDTLSEANRMDPSDFQQPVSPADYEQLSPQRPPQQPQQPQRQPMQPPRNQSLENERERLRRLFEQRRRAEAQAQQRR